MFRAKKVAHCKNYSITWKPQAPRVFWSWKTHCLVPSDLLLPCRYLGMRFLWSLPCAGSSPCVQDAYGLSEVHQCLEPDGPVAQQAMTVALIPCGYSCLLTLDCPQLSSSPVTVFNGRKLQVTPICGDSSHLISGQWWGGWDTKVQPPCLNPRQLWRAIPTPGSPSTSWGPTGAASQASPAPSPPCWCPCPAPSQVTVCTAISTQSLFPGNQPRTATHVITYIFLSVRYRHYAVWESEGGPCDQSSKERCRRNTAWSQVVNLEAGEE